MLSLKEAKYCFIVVLCFITGFLNAQSVDSLKKSNIEPAFDFDQRFYYFQHRWANVWGYREGLLINEKFKVGVGEYYMNENVSGPPIPKNINTDLPLSHNQKLYFGTAYFEPFLYRREYFETSLVFEGGYGRTVNTFQNPASGFVYDHYNKYFIPAAAGLSINVKFPAFFGWRAFRWFGINFVTGYRTSLWQGDIVHDYSGYYWSISSAIFLDRIFDDLRGRKHKK